MIEAFRRRGIFPGDVRTLSEDSLRWHAPDDDEQSELEKILPPPEEFRQLMPQWDLTCERRRVFDQMQGFQKGLEAYLRERLPQPAATSTPSTSSTSSTSKAFHILGLDPRIPAGELKVDAMRPARRIGPDGQSIVELVIEITQRVPAVPSQNGELWFRGGCTLLIEPDTARVRYAIVKNIRNTGRYHRQLDQLAKTGRSLRAAYFGLARRPEDSEAFALLHQEQPREAGDD